jgi:hypothetical protein
MNNIFKKLAVWLEPKIQVNIGAVNFWYGKRSKPKATKPEVSQAITGQVVPMQRQPLRIVLADGPRRFRPSDELSRGSTGRSVTMAEVIEKNRSKNSDF